MGGNKPAIKSPAHPYDCDETKIFLQKIVESGELQTEIKNLDGSRATQGDLHLLFDAPGQCGLERNH